MLRYISRTLLPMILKYRSNTENESASSIKPYRIIGELDINSRYLTAISSFYDSLMNSQELLGAEIEKVLYSNISQLYIE